MTMAMFSKGANAMQSSKSDCIPCRPFGGASNLVQEHRRCAAFYEARRLNKKRNGCFGSRLAAVALLACPNRDLT
jgi:hypothetical protein